MVFGLGGNIGDREAVLRWAIGQLRTLFGPLQVAPLYRTAPISPYPQADFLNTVILANLPTDAAPNPHEILTHIKALERRTGRLGRERDRPRTLDIDLLLFGNLIYPPPSNPDLSDPKLVLPHPRMRHRRFVLAPLNDLVPDLRLPPDGARVSDLLAALGPEQDVERIEEDWTVTDALSD